MLAHMSHYCLAVCLLKGDMMIYLHAWPLTAEMNLHILDHEKTLPHDSMRLEMMNKERVRRDVPYASFSILISSDLDGVKN